MKEIIKSQRLGEEYIQIEHPSGLTLMLYPMKGYSTAYALFATQCGSIDDHFKTQQDDSYVQVPAGIAHFLEHKLFECEDGDAFAKYAKTGASANAYTSFDRTAYLFSCSDQFKETLSILLDFVTKPYFTQQTVEKEQGIIGQEIRMYDDNPDWQVFFNLLGALYQKHPIRVDIAGTVESIAQINADLLYRCYRTFYNLNNMVLAIAGNFEVDTVLELCDQILKPAENIVIERTPVDEPLQVAQKRVEVHLPVAVSLFQIGFKGRSLSPSENFKGQILDEVLLEILAGESSPLYRRLYDKGLINSTFVGEILCGRDYISMLFSGESRDPDQVYEAICQEVAKVQKEGIDPETFARVKKSVYGRYIGMYSRVDAVAGLMVQADFAGIGVYEILDVLSQITKEQLEERLASIYQVEHSALSVVSPVQEQ